MGSSLDSVSNPAASTWYEFDVADHVTGNGTYSIGLKTTDGGGIFYSSKEGDYDPVLEVKYQ